MAERVAVVTGGTRGIGAAVSRMLKDKGYKVAATYAGNDDAANKFKAETGIAVYKFDVGDFAVCQTVINQIEKDLGPIEVLVNNAGITRDNISIRMKDEEWEKVLQVNLTGTFRLIRAALRGMMRRRFGRVVNITSIVGVTGNPGQGNYTAAKAGLIGMIKTLGAEYAKRNVTANCIAPGFIKTPMTDALNDKQRETILTKVPAARLGTPEDIAAAAVYLASNEAAYVTGQTIHVNGGMAMF